MRDRGREPWPLVGRLEELRFISDLLSRPPPSGLVLSGEAGVGKTRLALEALTRGEVAGCATAWATATEAAASIPFGALAHLLPVPASPAGGPPTLLRTAAKGLVEQAAGRRLALGIDDAHLLDAASATLVQQLAATSAAFVIVTVRSGQPAPDAIVALWKDGPIDYVKLQPLSQDDVFQILMEALGEVDGETLSRLWKATRGNALYLRELVREGLESGLLARPGGVWRWRGPLTPSVRLLELIDTRLGNLDGSERRVLELVAAGEPLGASALEGMAPPDTIERLERRGLLESSHESRRMQIRLAHPLYGEAIRARTPSLRARTIRRRLADFLGETGAHRRDDLLRLGTWRLESGSRARPELLLAASHRALACFDPALSGRLAQAAIDAGGDLAAQQALAEALQQQGRFEEAEAVFSTLTSVAKTDSERAHVAMTRVRNLFFGLGRTKEAEALIVDTAVSVSDPVARDELTAAHGWLLYYSGRPIDCLEAVSGLLSRDDITDVMGVNVAIFAAPALALVGRIEQAIALAERWFEPATRHTDELPLGPTQLRHAHALALYVAGRFHQAEAIAVIEHRTAQLAGSHEARLAWKFLLGMISLSRGNLRAAVRLLQETAALTREFDPVGALSGPLVYLAQARALLGDFAAAETALAEADLVRRPISGLWECDWKRARAWIAAAQGRLPSARALALEAAETAVAQGEFTFAVLGFHDLARLGEAVVAVSRIAAMLPLVEGSLAQACATHACALLARDGNHLLDAATGFEALGADLLAAEAASQAAAVFWASGRLASARAASARARVLVQRCEGARTPALAVAVADDLTTRERETAMLAADGLSNAMIAVRLGISTRTVENHLQHVYSKLGITSRSQLAQLSKRAGLSSRGDLMVKSE